MVMTTWVFLPGKETTSSTPLPGFKKERSATSSAILHRDGCQAPWQNSIQMDNAERQQSPAREGLVGRVVAIFRPYWAPVLLVGVLILITAGLGVVNPILIRVVFDDGLFPVGGPDITLLWILAGVMGATTIVGGVLGIGQTYLTNRVGQKVMRDLRDNLYRHLQSLPVSFFTNTRTGEIQSRVSNDVASVQNVVTSTVSNVISNGVIFISTLAAMFVLSW